MGCPPYWELDPPLLDSREGTRWSRGNYGSPCFKLKICPRSLSSFCSRGSGWTRLLARRFQAHNRTQLNLKEYRTSVWICFSLGGSTPRRCLFKGLYLTRWCYRCTGLCIFEKKSTGIYRLGRRLVKEMQLKYRSNRYPPLRHR